ncbi:flavin reductase family protein [Streptomyces sp. NPDC012888]|uniref:flavin reductase family protein n=1 Tax=Streptomyces sp. NPDC012888 TaxID=3364855 RepID=UPI0036BEEA6D
MAESEFDDFGTLLDPPVYVVTAAAPPAAAQAAAGAEGAEAGTERSGCLVGFASQCSIRPPRFMVWLSVLNHTYGVARRAEYLAVHLLDHDGLPLAELFGGETGDRVDKFARTPWRPCGPEGTPVLSGAAAWFLGRVRERHPAGDHVGFLLDISQVGPASPSTAAHGALISYQDVRDLPPGHPA